MDLLPGAQPATTASEVSRLRRQLLRERARRQAAEAIGERATGELYNTVLQLQRAQEELLDVADQSRVVSELGLTLRQDLDSADLVNHAAESAGRATGVDRCDVLMVAAGDSSAQHGSWSRAPERTAADQRSLAQLPSSLRLLLESTRPGAVRIDDVEEDPRLEPQDASEMVSSFGVRAFAAVPIARGHEVTGWLMLQSRTPHPWREREIDICRGMSHELASSLIQVRAYERERESVLRLRELDRAKDSFISTVSHELRTPLASIVGYLELLSEGELGPISGDATQGIGIIERNVDRLRILVDDLLTLSAYDASQVRLQLEPMDLLAAVTDCRDELLPAAAARAIEVRITAEPALPRVFADRSHIDRVVQNLLSNAIKFNREGGAVTLALRAEGTRVVLSVTDTGIGIPADEQARLFQRFFRSSLSVEDEIQGTGLGLALVQTELEWHDGSVDIESTEGQGTVVTVRLPQATGDA